MSRWCSNQLSYAPEETQRYKIKDTRCKPTPEAAWPPSARAATTRVANQAARRLDGLDGRLVHNPQLHFLNVPDLVADLRGFLKFEISRMLVHLPFEFLEALD